MTVYVALLRGINVGGNRRVKMDELRSVVETAGFDDVATYIQSGNVVFSGRRAKPTTVARALEAGIEAAFGFDVPVIVLTADELAAVVDAQPYAEADPAHLHVSFLPAPPDPDAIAPLDLAGYAPEELTVDGAVVYFHLPNGLGRSKLVGDVTKTKRGAMASGTMRNWRTVRTLRDMAASR